MANVTRNTHDTSHARTPLDVDVDVLEVGWDYGSVSGGLRGWEKKGRAASSLTVRGGER